MDIEKVKRVLNEILVVWKLKAPVQGHLMYEAYSQTDYTIKLTLPDAKDCIDCIKPIVEKHGLAMKQSEGYLIIYSL
jgi:hypothetical protein